MYQVFMYLFVIKCSNVKVKTVHIHDKHYHTYIYRHKQKSLSIFERLRAYTTAAIELFLPVSSTAVSR